MTVMTRTQIKKELSALPQDEFNGRLKECLRLIENYGWGSTTLLASISMNSIRRIGKNS